MKTFFRAGLVLVALAGPAVAAETQLEGDLGRLQGRWSARVGPQNDIRVELTVEGQRAKVVISTPQGLTIRARGLLHIDETRLPRTLDWTDFKSMDGRTLPDIPAIYRIDEQGWTICNGGPNGTRPETFRAGDGLLAGVVLFKRTEIKTSQTTPKAKS
jgi:uncharacterized protein (TIGR03067 family)